MKNETLPTDTLVDVIVPEAVVAINIGSGFYQRILSVVDFVAKGKGEADLIEAAEQIQNGSVEEGSWAAHYETLISFCKEFETEAAKAGFIKKVTLEEYAQMLD